MASIRKLEVSELPAVQESQREKCYLYVVQEAGEPHFKIGIAGHPLRRLSDLQSGNRHRLRLVAAYAGSRTNCLYIEKIALKFFKAAEHSEWVWTENLVEITEFLDSFCEGGPQ